MGHQYHIHGTGFPTVARQPELKVSIFSPIFIARYKGVTFGTGSWLKPVLKCLTLVSVIGINRY